MSGDLSGILSWPLEVADIGADRSAVFPGLQARRAAESGHQNSLGNGNEVPCPVCERPLWLVVELDAGVRGMRRLRGGGANALSTGAAGCDRVPGLTAENAENEDEDDDEDDEGNAEEENDCDEPLGERGEVGGDPSEAASVRAILRLPVPAGELAGGLAGTGDSRLDRLLAGGGSGELEGSGNGDSERKDEEDEGGAVPPVGELGGGLHESRWRDAAR